MLAANTLSTYSGSSVRDEDLKLTNIRQEERKQKKEATAAMSRYSGVGVSEDELKLKRFKEEERKKHREAQEYMKRVQYNEVPTFKKESKYKKPDTEHLPPFERRNDDEVIVTTGTVKDKAGIFSHDWDVGLSSPQNRMRGGVAGNGDSTSELPNVPMFDGDASTASLSVKDRATGFGGTGGGDATAEAFKMEGSANSLKDEIQEEEVIEIKEEEEDVQETADVGEIKSETEQPKDTETEPEPASQPDQEPDTQPEPDTQRESEQEPEQQPEPESQPKPEPEKQPEPEPEPESQPESETQPEPEPEPETQPEPKLESETQPEPEPEPKQEAPAPKSPKAHHESPDEIAVSQAKSLKGHKFKVRLDVLFSFGLLTSSEKPFLDNYMGAVEEVVKGTIAGNKSLKTHCRYDPGYGPFVQEFTTDKSYTDPLSRPNVRRILVIAAIPIFLTNGISIKEAREGICSGLQKTMKNGEFVQIAKRGGFVDQPSTTQMKEDKYMIM